MFNVGSIVTGENFLDRRDFLKEIGKYYENGQSFIIKAPRRYGKSSLVEESLRRYKERDPKNLVAVLDIKKFPTTELLIDSLLNQFYSALGIAGFVKRAKENIVELLSSLKEFSIGLDDLKITLELTTSEKQQGVSELCTLLDEIESLCRKRELTLHIFFDEFQDILKYDDPEVLDQLRATLQRHEKITYIFAGSIERLMKDIFEKKEAPFYKFGVIIELTEFDKEDIKEDITKQLEKKNIVFEDDEDLDMLLEKLGCHPYNTIMTMQKIYYQMLDEDIKLIKKEHIERGYVEAYESTKRLIEADLMQTKNSKGLYKLIYEMANGEADNLEPGIRYVRRTELENLGLIVKRGRDNYTIPDGFMVEYLQSLE